MNRFSGVADKTMNQRPNGSGVPMRWRCLHCAQVRDLTGSRGAGVMKRCAVCVAKRAAA